MTSNEKYGCDNPAKSKEINIKTYEKVINIQKSTVFQVETSKQIYLAKNIIVATGFYDIPNLMDIPGEDLPKVSHYYTEPYPYSFQKVLVVS